MYKISGIKLMFIKIKCNGNRIFILLVKMTKSENILVFKKSKHFNLKLKGCNINCSFYAKYKQNMSRDLPFKEKK